MITLVAMTTLRKRNNSLSSLNKGDDFGSSDDRTEKIRDISGFSDDESLFTPPAKESSNSRMNIEREMAAEPMANDMMAAPGVTTHSQFTVEAEEVEGDIEIFNKAIHITNLEQVDHAGLLLKMHSRFKKKVTKWENLAYLYARYNFLMNFTVLLIQIFVMIVQQAASIWMDQKVAETLYSLLTAITALLAGLQMKLKMNEKAERYRRGAKVYGRLLRISTYYIMMLESGGKIEDVTGLWREAMKKEGKWIPLVRSFMPM